MCKTVKILNRRLFHPNKIEKGIILETRKKTSEDMFGDSIEKVVHIVKLESGKKVVIDGYTFLSKYQIL